MSLRAALSFREYPLQQQSEEDSFARYSVQQHMLADDARVQAFSAAVAQAVKPGDIVVDIGAGTGLLSYWALKAGAQHVHVIEASSMATCCAAHLEAAGFADQFTLHRAMSFDVQLPTRVDVILSETLGHLGIDEGILNTLSDAKKRFAHEHTRIIPNAMQLTVAPVHTPLFEREMRGFWKRGVHGFALQAGAEALSQMSYLTALSTHEYLSAMQVFKTFELGTVEQTPFEGTIAFASELLRTPSTLSGFALSFRCDLGSPQLFSAQECASWGPVFLPLLEPLRIHKGASMNLEMSLMGIENRWHGTIIQHDTEQLKFTNGYRS